MAIPSWVRVPHARSAMSSVSKVSTTLSATVEHEAEGPQSGLAYTDPDGRGSILARSPDDLHAVAARIDELMAALSDMEPRLQVALPLQQTERS